MPTIVSPLGDNGEYNVKAYGAKGDNTTDDSAAIQRALNAAGTAGRGTVVIPPGQYKLNTQLEIKTGTTLFAYGAYLWSGNNNYLLVSNVAAATVYNGGRDIKVYGGIWDGKAQSVASEVAFNIMGFYHCRNVLVQDVTIRNVASWHGLEFNASNNCTLRNARFEGFRDTTAALSRQFSAACQIDISTNDSTPSKNITIDGCYVGAAIDGSGLGSFGRGFDSHTDAASKWYTGIHITNNVIEDTIGIGIQTYSWNDSLVSHNIIKNAGGQGIVISGNAANNVSGLAITNNVVNSVGSGFEVIDVSSRTVSSTTVSNNVFRDCGTSTPSCYLRFMTGCTVSGNTVNGGGNIGISAISVVNSVITGNSIYTPGHDGIRLGTGTTGTGVSNNVINGGPQRGIYLIGSGASNTVMSNTVINTGAGTMGNYEISSTSGANNAFIGNRAVKGTGTASAAIRTVSGGATTTAVIGNSAKGFSSTYGTAFDFGAAVEDDIAGTTTANSTVA